MPTSFRAILYLLFRAAMFSSMVSIHFAWGSVPFLAFSDLASGPDHGLGNGSGDGVIVTVWGQNLGSTQATSRLLFIDGEGERHEPHIYYWKDADGNLPSGPANLFESHRMQEIAFSVPVSSSGAAEIRVEKGTHASNGLEYTVREGEIYHVKSTGSDSGTGSWSDPWATVGYADSQAPSGSTIYIHDVNTGHSNAARAIYWHNSAASSSLKRQFGLLAYPGFRPTVSAQRAIENYKTEAMVVSKLDVYASNYKGVDVNDQPVGGGVTEFGETYGIQSSKNGRVSNFKAYGNEIHHYGCHGSGKLHHTTYMAIRSAPYDLQVARSPHQHSWCASVYRFGVFSSVPRWRNGGRGGHLWGVVGGNPGDWAGRVHRSEAPPSRKCNIGI